MVDKVELKKKLWTCTSQLANARRGDVRASSRSTTSCPSKALSNQSLLDRVPILKATSTCHADRSLLFFYLDLLGFLPELTPTRRIGAKFVFNHSYPILDFCAYLEASQIGSLAE